MPRLFHLAEAEALLPEVDRAIRDAVAVKPRLAAAEAELEAFLRRLSMLGGCRVDPHQLAELRLRRELAATSLNEAIDKIQRLGCEVKDLDIGLVDFPTRYQGRIVCLCWKLGEPSIRFWHGGEEGFGGRKPIDQDFLDHHQGDPLV